MTERIASTIKDIHKVIDKKDGGIVEDVYNLVEMKISNAKRMAEENVTCNALIYYAENLLEDFAMALSPKEQSLMLKKINHLKKMNEQGTYEQNIQAYKNLDSFLNDFPMLNLFMTLQKAGNLCYIHEPSRAAKFHNAVSNILEATGKKNTQRVETIIKEIRPEAIDVIQKIR